jgi:hypothetical protein
MTSHGECWSPRRQAEPEATPLTPVSPLPPGHRCKADSFLSEPGPASTPAEVVAHRSRAGNTTSTDTRHHTPFRPDNYSSTLLVIHEKSRLIVVKGVSELEETHTGDCL